MSGPAVVAAHVDSRTGPASFYRLGEVQPGASIFVDYDDGSSVRFLAQRIEQHPKDAFRTTPTDGPRLTARAVAPETAGRGGRVLAVTLVAVTLVAGSSLDPRGPVAETIADLWWVLLGIGVAVFTVFAVLLVGGLFRRRATAEQPDGPTPDAANRWLVVGGVAMPLVILVIVYVATVVAMRDVPTTAPPEALVIEVVGHQWWWEVRYPEQGVTTANEIHIPVGRPVAFQLVSADVIHSFWVPALAGKLDALPDDVTTLVLQAAEPGEYRGECAEFCGLQHAKHGLLVVAEPEERFASWVAGRQEAAVEPAEPAPVRGQEVFFAAGCASCHAIKGTRATADVGPDLTHLATRNTLGAVAISNTSEHLAEWVADPHSIKSGVEMPATELSDEELDALVAYLETLE